MGGESLFSLHDAEKERNFWIAVGQVSEGVEAVAYDPERGRLTLRYGEAEREVELSRARIREIDPPDPEDLSPERRREEWRALREELRAIRGRWEAAAKDSSDLREIESHFRELGEEIRDVMIGIAVAEEGSADYRRLVERRGELSEEFRLLFNHSLDTVESHSGFEPGDSDALRRAQRLLPQEWR